MRNILLNTIVMFVTVAIPVEATIRYVPSQYLTIQAAINSASPGDTVLVADGTYTGAGNRNISFFGKVITVRSESGPESCIIDCQGLGRGFYFQSHENRNSVLDGFTIINGYVTNSNGGGILCEDSSPTVTNCIFRNNTAYSSSAGLSVFGGGMCNSYGSSPLVTDCVFIGNSGGWGGGMANLVASRPTVTKCVFIGNSTQHMGGGMFNTNSSYVTVSSCTFISNSSDGLAGGMWNYQSNIGVINCTFSGNSAARQGGGIYIRESSPVLSNCIFWSNSDRGGTGQSAQIYIKNGSVVVNYCCIMGWTGSLGGTGNDPCDPLLESDGYRLRLGSPCINAGNNAFVLDETDIDGRPRIHGGRVDMGAYEFNHAPIADTGPDQTVYAWFDGVAKVILDGTGSYDDDGDRFRYLWSWTVDGNNFTATDPRPLIELPIGEYVIELTVNDGIDDSEPNEVVIIVIPPMETTMKLTPQALNINSQGKWVKAHFVLPEGFGVEDIDADTPAIMEPLGIESEYMNVFVNEEDLVEIEIVFGRAALCGFKIDEPTEVAIVGLLTSGQYFYGTDTIKIVTGMQSVAVFISYWLEADCGAPDWCDGFDLDHNGVVNFVDLAKLDGCCIEVIKE